MAKFWPKYTAKEVGNFFWKTVIFPNIWQIWHYLATLVNARSSLHFAIFLFM